MTPTENQNAKSTFEYPTPYTAWLACLFFVLAKVRREGLMALEGEVENPRCDNAIFLDFPQTLEEPYLQFAADILVMMVAGNLNAPDMQVYADHAMAGHAAEGKADLCLLKTIWLTLWAAMNGYAPQVAIEFGRQAIPVRDKPSRAELEALISAARKSGYDVKPRRQEIADLDTAVDRFVASLND